MAYFSQLITENFFWLFLLAIFLGWQLGKNKSLKMRHFDFSGGIIFWKKKKFFLLSLLVAIGAVGIFFFLEKKSIDFLPKNEIKELVFEEENYQSEKKLSKGGLDLVFFADGYSSWEEFNADVDALIQGIKTFTPWKEYPYFNIHKINLTSKKTEICKVKTKDEIKPVLRCTEEINQYLAKLNLEKFRLIVLSREDFQSWANVSRIENGGIFFSLTKKIEKAEIQQQGLLLAHLLGHSFGLKDEEKYVIARAGGAPHTPDGPNCAPDEETAKEWWGDLVEKYPDQIGYFKTCCGNENYIKPTRSSLMNLGDEMENFQPNYGLVSELYLKKILDYCFSPQKVQLEKDPTFFARYPEFKKCL